MIDLTKLKERILTQGYPSPQRMLLVIAVSIFTVEAGVMTLLANLPPMTYVGEMLVDAATLTAVILPVLFFLFYRPFLHYINDLKSAEEDLLRFATAIDQGLDAIMITNPDGNIQYVNPAFTAITGYTWDEAINNSPRMLDTGTHGPAMERMWTTIYSGGDWRGEIPRRKKNGNTYHSRLRVSPVKDVDGSVSNLVFVEQDITAEKLAQDERENYLHRVEELSTYNENLIQKAPIGAWIINFHKLTEADKTGDPCYEWHRGIGVKIVTERVNDRMAEMLGRTKGEIIGRSIFDPIFVDDENARKYVDEILRRREGKQSSYELTLLHRSGEAVHVLIGAIPTKTDLHTGAVTQSLGMFLDLTERKKAEQEREMLIIGLNRANEELRDFAYIVSHDLKAPLRAIGSLAEWIAKDYGDILGAEGRENLDLLLGRTKRMNNLIEGILRYSRAGRIKPELDTLDCAKTARAVIDAVGPPPNIKVAVEGDLPKVIYDRTHLEQVFQNLISNAIKHHGKAAGNVTLSCRDAGEMWEFCVRDDGQGIEEKHFDRIFKIFQSLKSRDEVESTGIGLTLVKKIVERYGGTVWVRSTVDAGSEFFFTVPKFPQNVDDDTARILAKELNDIRGAML
ncbi:MAG: PAS domain S-box protein [Nitrospinae bacterium]|nr:PAS domain S-box protein [Nitrospinota bacterium]